MGKIEVHPERFREQLHTVLNAAQPLASMERMIAVSGSSQALSALLVLWGKLCSCAAAYYRVLQSDVMKAEGLMDSIIQEDQQIGEVIENGGGISDQTGVFADSQGWRADAL